MNDLNLHSFEYEWGKIQSESKCPDSRYDFVELADNGFDFVIFGTGKTGYALAEHIRTLNLISKLKAFCSMYNSGYDKDYSLPIIMPDDLLRPEYSDSVIIVAVEPVFYPAYYDEMLYICNGLGIDRRRVYKCVDGFLLDNFKVGSLSDFEYNFYDGYKLAYDNAPDIATKRAIINRIRDYCWCDEDKVGEVLQSIEYSSCRYVENGYIRFGGNLGDKICKFCCARLKDGNQVPAFYIHNNPAASLDALTKARAKIRAENIASSVLGNDDIRVLTRACVDCNMFIKSGWRRMKNDLVTNITYEIYPAPCQGKCIYCDVHCTERGHYSKSKHMEQSLNVLRTIEYGDINGYYSESATYHIITGEIAIHPLKDEILRIVKGRYTQFGTNAFIYDEQIGHLDNFGLYYSIDAGTESTWKAVKGVDNFQTAMDNLRKYVNASGCGENINLKYVIVPGYNDNLEDYFGIVDIMNDLGIKTLMISCAYRYTGVHDESDRKLLMAAGLLYRVLLRNNKIPVINSISFQPEEARRIVSYAGNYDIAATIPE